MKIAFYAPLKPPGHPVASGDRTMARALIAALERAGHDVEVASTFRSFDAGDPHRQKRLQELGSRLAERLIRQYLHAPSSLWGEDRGGLPTLQSRSKPDLWFTYHLYHKAPDWLGPQVAARLGIPYVAAEASFAPKQASGKWGPGHRAVEGAIRSAARLVQLNPADAECVLPLLDSPEKLIRFAPFTDTASFRKPDRDASRAALTARYGIPQNEPWLLTIAMMRNDQKLLSYRALATSFLTLPDLPWRLVIAGAGPAEADVHAAFAPLAHRITWLGILSPDELRQLYRAADLYVWPAIKEAFGMTLVEAQAAGLAVIAGRSGGVASVVSDGETGLLPPEGDVTAFAASVRSLIVDLPRRRAMGEAAMRRAASHLDISSAAALLDRELRALVPALGP
jgi:glycosyltransferase involved in cell wall biosynthesis